MEQGVTLEGLRQEASKRYADYPVHLDETTWVVLRAPLRLSTDDRSRLRQLQRSLSDMRDDPQYSDVDLLETLRNMIRTVANDRRLADQLIEAIGEDLALLQTLFEDYSERTQAGEASHSAD